MHICKLLIFFFSFTLHLFLLIARLKGSKRLLGYLCFSLATSNVNTSSFTSFHEHVLLITFYSELSFTVAWTP